MKSWTDDVRDCVKDFTKKHPEKRGQFIVEEIYNYEKWLSRRHPDNFNVRAKIRQQLQVLVAQGVLLRRSRGAYEVVKA